MPLNSRTLALHVTVMIIWTVVVLISLLIKRYVKNTFKVYIWLQSLGLVIMILGSLGIEIIAPVVENEPISIGQVEKAHVTLGLATVFLAITQPISGAVILLLYHKCGHSSKEVFNTWYYKLAHVWVGRVVIILLLVNTFIGIMNFTEPGSGWRTTGSSFGLMMSAYIGFLIVVVIIAVYFERRKRNQKEEERRALLEEQGYYMDLV